MGAPAIPPSAPFGPSSPTTPVFRAKSRRTAKVTERAPYPTDDSTQGYTAGDLWGMKNGTLYMCQSTTANNATWTQTDASNVPLNNNAPPLDRVTGATAAYGVFKLRTAYAGSAFQIKRASDSTTLDIGFVFDPDRRIYVADWSAVDRFLVGTTGTLFIWYDQSGNGNDATATANVVTIGVNEINGLRVLSFYGTALTQMALPVGVSVSRQACTVISSGLVEASGHGNAFCELGNDATYSNRILLTTITRDGRVQAIGNVNLAAAVRLESGPSVVGASFGASTSNYMCNDATSSAGAFSAFTLTGGFIGSANSLGYAYWGDYASLIIYGSALTTAQMQTLRQAHTKILRIQPQCRDVLVLAGDSITAGADTPNQPWWRQGLQDIDRDYRVFNNALEGDTALAETSGYTAVLGNAYVAGRRNVAFIGSGTNDLATLSAANGDTPNATTVYNRIVALAALARATGYLVVLGTILPRTGSLSGGQTTGSFEASRLIINASIRTNLATIADGIADYGGDPLMGSVANIADTTLYNSSLHPKEKGHGFMKAWAIPAINGLA